MAASRLHILWLAAMTALVSTIPLACLAQSPPPLGPAAGPPPVQTTIASAYDPSMRMTVPVTIDGKGPFQFVVDTGADRTVVSRELAGRLGLAPSGEATMHSMAGVQQVSTVALERLGIAGRIVPHIDAPALAEEHLGAHGLLGIDGLKNRRIIMNFVTRTLTIAEPGTTEATTPDTIVVTARSRFGQLVLVDAEVDGTRVTVVIDSGAQNSIGNPALKALLMKRNRSMSFVSTEMIDVTGARLAADVALVARVRIGRVNLRQVGVAFADAHPFKRYGLENRPAMLLGINTLRSFRRVSIDFGQKKVRFLLPGEV